MTDHSLLSPVQREADLARMADDHFDIVCAMVVLHHVENPRPMINAIRRELKPGGKMIVMLYCRYSRNAIFIIHFKRLFDSQYSDKCQKEALNMNDGEDCPLALVCGKSEARDLLSGFEAHLIRLNQLSWRQLLLSSTLAWSLAPFSAFLQR